MPTLQATGKRGKASTDPAQKRILRLESMTRKLAQEIEDIRDLLEIQQARKADAGKKLLSLDEAWESLGLR